jgi:hypothetical protein
MVLSIRREVNVKVRNVDLGRCGLINLSKIRYQVGVLDQTRDAIEEYSTNRFLFHSL